MRKLFLVVSIFLATACSQETENRCLWGKSYLKVKTSNGYVEGYLGESCRTGKPFAGFQGIPYAEPPVGELRFRDPVPKGKWNGTWDATYERPSCFQNLDDSESPVLRKDNRLSEDCLYLSVYTPNLKYLKYGLAFPKAVMVFIHPGAFNTGSNSEVFFSPDFLIDQDVVVVTLKYRLGAMGFLSFQNEEVPGNAGLKDQNLALKWVKENIRKFGGDPSKITIFGESAGSASVNYHILSKASAGLFNSAIMQSGSALSPWAYSPPDLALKKALSLGYSVGCIQKEVSEVLKCMREVPAEVITNKQQDALTLEELFSLRIIAFHPTTEPNMPGAFLTAHPFDVMFSGNFTKVPTIIGSNADEGLLIYPALMKHDPKGYLLTLLGMDLSRFAPYNFRLKPFTKAAIYVHQKISRFYFNSKFLTKALLRNVLELVTDVMFTLPIQLTASMLSSSSTPVYNYFFQYDGGYNALKHLMNITDVKGTNHGDDLGYLFYMWPLHTKCGSSNAPVDSADEIMIDRMTKMWANFAKTGNPTPKLDSEIGCMWQPFTPDKRNYLDIDHELVPSDSLKMGNMLFWDNLIRDLIEMNNTKIQTGEEQAIDKLKIDDLDY